MTFDEQFRQNRRAFLGRTTGGAGNVGPRPSARAAESGRCSGDGRSARRRALHHAPRADAVICLFQHGGPSQMDLFDPKPELTKRNGKPYHGQSGSAFSRAERKPAGVAVQVRTARQVRHRTERAVAAHRRHRRRDHAPPRRDDRIGRSRSRRCG